MASQRDIAALRKRLTACETRIKNLGASIARTRALEAADGIKRDRLVAMDEADLTAAVATADKLRGELAALEGTNA